METTLVTAGIVFVAAAIIGGGLKAFQIEIPAIDTLFRQLLLGGFGVALILIGTIGLDTGGSSATGPEPPSGPPWGETGGGEAPNGPSTTSLEDCVVTVENELVSLKREPSPVSQGAAKVPPGDYDAEEYTTTQYAGTEMGFFRITVDGRTGWIADNTFDIESKTSTCP